PLAITLDRLAHASSQLGRHDRAIALYEEALAIRRRDQADDAPEVLHSYNAIGNALLRAGRSDEAEPLLRRAADGALARFGQQHVKTAHYQKTHATSLMMLRRPQEAADQLALAVATERELYPAHSPDVVLGINNLAALELMLG